VSTVCVSVACVMSVLQRCCPQHVWRAYMFTHSWLERPNCCFAFHAGFPPQSVPQAGPDASIPSTLTEQVTQGASSLMAVGSVAAAARQDQALLTGECQQTTAEATASLPNLRRGADTMFHVKRIQSKSTHHRSSQLGYYQF